MPMCCRRLKCHRFLIEKLMSKYWRTRSSYVTRNYCTCKYFHTLLISITYKLLGFRIIMIEQAMAWILMITIIRLAFVLYTKPNAIQHN